MKTVVLSMLLFVALGLRAAEPEPLVVHEWGVMVRATVQVKDDSMRADAKRPLLAPPQEWLSGAPAFVQHHINSPVKQYREWDKPVIHFYGPEGLDVEARVLTPHGRPLAHYPVAKLLSETFWQMGSGVTEVAGMQWNGRLSKQPSGKEPKVDLEHWWNTARSIPSMYFSADNGDAERFIFWEGYALQEPFVSAAIKEDTLEVANDYEEASGPVLVIVNDGAARRGWALLKDIPARGRVKVNKDELFKADGGEAALLAACRSQWEAFGMTKEEARAIVEIWKPDLLGAQGFLVVSRMPVPVFDKLFPLEIKPKPASIVRAPVVFDTLPGVEGRMAWLPELQKQMATWGKDLGHEEFAVREKAAQAFRHAGDLATRVLEDLAKSHDHTVSAEAQALLGKLQPARLEPLPVHGRASKADLVPAGER